MTRSRMPRLALEQFYDMGCHAFLMGVPISQCPFSRESTAAHYWRKGHNNARHAATVERCQHGVATTKHCPDCH